MSQAAAGESVSTASQNNHVLRGTLGRFRLALVVVLGCFLAIFLMVFALFVIKAPETAATAETVFNVILPVLASWMGTVLAFYFSAQSLETTSDNLKQALGQPARPIGGGTKISEKMIPISSIRGRIDLAEKPAGTIKLSDLQEQFGTPANGATIVTRLMFLEKSIFRYVLHVGTFNGFLVKRGGSAGDLTFADLLDDADIKQQISKLVVFVAESATLADAKIALDAVPGAQDIIVTENGDAGAAMRGWMTHTDLSKAISAT